MKIKLDIPLRLYEICEAAKISRKAFSDRTISRITTDSRLCEAGDLFIALDGERYNGSDYVNEAVERGAIAISNKESKESLYVSDTREALLSISKLYKERLPKLKHTVAVTGSVGKSTTKEFIKEILKEKYKIHATEGNYNNDIGVPYTILTSPVTTEVLVIEMGMNHAGEIGRLSSCTAPDIAVITNIGTAHIGNLGSRAAIAEAKLEIRSGMSNGSTLFVPYEEELLSGTNAVRVSVENEQADAFLCPDDMGITGSIANFRFGDRIISGLKLKQPGSHMLKNLAFAIAVSVKLELENEEILKGVLSISDKNTRQKYIDLDKFIIYDDSYNASYESLAADFDLFLLHKNKKLSALLSDILELGEHSQDLHKKVGFLAAKRGFCKLYLFGKYAEEIKAGAIEGGMDADSVYVGKNPDSPRQCANEILRQVDDGEIILAKASHATNMKKIIDIIVEDCKNGNAG